MPQQCSVCKHKERARIDSELAFQVVNMAQIGRTYGLSADAVRRHRLEHLPAFLPAFAADAAPREPGTIRAEAERLYLVTLDALAQAEAGVRVWVDDEGTERRRVSMSTVARLIREARAGLDLLTKLSVASGSGDVAPEGVNLELDARINAALDRVERRQLMSSRVVDAEVVADDEPRPSPTTPGPSAADAPAASRDPDGTLFTETPSPARKAGISDEEWRELIREGQGT